MLDRERTIDQGEFLAKRTEETATTQLSGDCFHLLVQIFKSFKANNLELSILSFGPILHEILQTLVVALPIYPICSRTQQLATRQLRQTTTQSTKQRRRIMPARQRSPAPIAIDPDRYYSLRDAAQCLQVSQPWLRERRREGLAAIEVRGRVWLAGSDIIAFLDSHRTSTSNA